MAYTQNVARKTLFGSATLDFPSIPGNSFAELTIAVVGAKVNDNVILGVPVAAVSVDVTFMVYVSANNVVTVRCANPTNGAKNPSPGLFTVSIII